MTERLLPTDTADPLFAPMWQGFRAGRLVLQHCSSCRFVRFPAAERCPECWTPGATWAEVPAVGTIWSYTVYHRPLHPAFQGGVPYTVAAVDLDVGPRIPGRVLVGDQAPRIGDRVEGHFSRLSPEVSMLDWTLAGDQNSR